LACPETKRFNQRFPEYFVNSKFSTGLTPSGSAVHPNRRLNGIKKLTYNILFIGVLRYLLQRLARKKAFGNDRRLLSVLLNNMKFLSLYRLLPEIWVK
jgi:hypothetical protein